MVRFLEARRQRILRELAHLDRRIAFTQQRMAEIQARMANLNQVKAKAA
jgi:prefoldin subunit 5